MKFEKINYLAFAILAVMAALLYFSSLNDSAIMDELAHIPAGYSYLTEEDYRLNPEHPPLMKDLAATPLLFQQETFPTNTKAWREDINGQWDEGTAFLYQSGNDANSILYWMRLPVMLLALFFGWLFFRWTKKRFGARTAVLALTFYAFSPTFLAHAHYVTTDLAAAFGFFIGIASFLAFLHSPRWKNIWIAGIALGVAELLKFSLVLIIPLYAILLVVWAAIQTHAAFRDRILLLGKLAWKTLVIGVIGLALIWVVYLFHVWNYPVERQYRDTAYILNSFGLRLFANFDIWMIHVPLLRPLAQYFLGVLMVMQRVAGGNTTYFLGDVSATASSLYFPTLYLLKEPLALHLLTLLALGTALWKTLRLKTKSFAKIFWWMRDHFTETTAWIFILFYWGYSIHANLNIGIRHLLPTFPFIYLLVSKEISAWIDHAEYGDPETWYGWLKGVYAIYIRSIPKYLLVGVLLIWLVGDTLITFPSFLSYYNELAGGTENGYRYAVDSNYDWGQDLRRLADFVKENHINAIAVDYFGGGNPAYYLGSAFIPWWSSRGPAHGWFAVSATFQMGAFGTPTKGFIRKPEDSYSWLHGYQPIARAGKSIFIYHLP